MKMLRALIVDPDEVGRQQIARRLDECGFDSVEAGDGIRALKFTSDSAIDLIVTDLQLPKLGALALLDIIQGGAFGEKPPPVIVCSDLLHDQAWLTNPLLRGLTLLAKPFTPRAFATALDAAFPAD